MDLDVNAIHAVHERIAPHIVATPQLYSKTFSELCGAEVWFKFENLQMTSSFKERGALNRLLQLTPAERERGVIAASAGNHAQAVAYHAGRLGISAKIVMPRHSPIVKVQSTRHWQADVVLYGENFDEALHHSRELEANEGRVYVHPFDDPHVMAGQATLALEVLAAPGAADLDAVIVPVGGGGLIGGMARYIKATRPDVQVIGVEEASVASMAAALAAGEPVQLPPAPSSIADGIAVRQVARVTLAAVQEAVEAMTAVSSDEIANAVLLMLEIEKSLVEPSGAVGIAALVQRRLPALLGKKVVVVITGGNIDVNLLTRIINRGLAVDRRLFTMDTVVPDTPGGLEGLLGIIRELGANVLEVHHHRYSNRAPIGSIGVSVTVETRDGDHITLLQETLRNRGYVLAEATPIEKPPGTRNRMTL